MKDEVRERFEANVKSSGLALYMAYEHGRGYLDTDTWKAFLMYAAGERAGIERAAQLVQDESGYALSGELQDGCTELAKAIRALVTSEEK